MESPACEKCKHCQNRPPSRPRGLCWECHRNLEIRFLYSISDHPSGRRAPDGRGKKKLPVPTQEQPGSEEKIKILMQRFEDGEELFHPEDKCLPIRSHLAHGKRDNSRVRLCIDPGSNGGRRSYNKRRKSS